MGRISGDPIKKRRKRKIVYERYGGVCYHCGIPLTLETMTLDHVQPRSKGGNNLNANFVPSCEPCNQRRDDRDWGDDSWLALPDGVELRREG